MAERIKRELTDDLSGVSSADDPTVATRHWSLSGKDYEAEFSDESFKHLEEALFPFNEVARIRSDIRMPRRQVQRTAASRDRSREIRAWAKKNGVVISDRGRIAADVVDMWEAATA